MYVLGYDIGSSSVKASLVEAESGRCVASGFFPKQEMEILAVRPGWAEQRPEMWWENLCRATASVLAQARIDPAAVGGIGISYQMHGLVLVGHDGQVLRPAIIWCDSRAVPYGEQAFEGLGKEYCLEHLLNSPGNFTAAKLAWVRENEIEVYKRIYKVLLPGDYIAMKLTGEMNTTIPGLSEGMFWDFKAGKISAELPEFYGIDPALLATVVPTFGEQGKLSTEAARLLGLKAGTPVCYRAGDQPNNALSLNVLEPGEIASTCGTSGVVYGISDRVQADPLSRINMFAHVNYTVAAPRLGVMHCVNGAGILNAWMKRNVAPAGVSYDEINRLAGQVPVGAEGLSVVPFGNGAERILQNRDTGASLHGIGFNIHRREHLLRAAQEGIAFSFAYGIEIMEKTGMPVRVIKAGLANMYQSPVFRETLAGVTHAVIELYDTDGSVGAARGAGIGAGIYRNAAEAFASLKQVARIEPEEKDLCAYNGAYELWKKRLSEA